MILSCYRTCEFCGMFYLFAVFLSKLYMKNFHRGDLKLRKLSTRVLLRNHWFFLKGKSWLSHKKERIETDQWWDSNQKLLIKVKTCEHFLHTAFCSCLLFTVFFFFFYWVWLNCVHRVQKEVKKHVIPVAFRRWITLIFFIRTSKCRPRLGCS